METERREHERAHLEIAPLDYISWMPDFIIHHILSFLRARDVTCTSMLSRTWNRIWSTYPYVVFHFSYNNYATEQEQLPDDLHMAMQKQDFLILIGNSIHRRLKQEFRVQRFQLYIDFPDIELLEPNMDQWIGIAVQRTVPELALCVDSFSGSNRSYYSVPQSVLLAGSLKALSLSGCRFESSLDIKLPHLQKLSLSHIPFADKFLFYKILSGCPVIEYVKVSFCKWMDTLLSVSSLPHLKYFEFLYSDEVDRILIDVSGLHTFSFASSIGNWPRNIDLATCKELKELKLRGVTANFFPQPLISQLLALEVLELQHCHGSEGFRISSQRLKKLAFRDCHHFSGAEIDTPNLEFFEYCNCDEPFIPIKASNQIQIHLRFSLRGKTVDWVVKLKDFISKLRYFEDLKFVIYHRSKNVIIHEKLSEVGFSSLCHFMHPKYICISTKSYTNILDELFPLVYPKTIFVVYSSSKIIELVSQKMKDVVNDPTLLHKLVDFEMDTSKDSEHPSDPATELFIEAHSTTLFKTAAIVLHWKYDVSKHSVTL
ncbi:hypothetical protein ACH5RR_008654 [Cinchona calisaya]|uniref:F-box domain-containing protein n=1 Tax=Cinchona calisaya TaxID=153742 RepID=A0ABD3AC86_9GENT